MVKKCVMSEISKTPETGVNSADETLPGATFQISNSKLYAPVVPLFINNIKLLENIKQGFKRISCNKYRFEITTQPKNNTLDFLIDQIFRNINRLFAFSFKNGDDITRNSFDECDIGRNQRF